MGHEDFHQLLAAGHDDCPHLMYQYGHACGLQNAINFSQIKQTFSNLQLSKTEGNELPERDCRRLQEHQRFRPEPIFRIGEVNLAKQSFKSAKLEQEACIA